MRELIEESLSSEYCPFCDQFIEDFPWNYQKFGYHTLCPYCGEQLGLCDACQHRYFNEESGCFEYLDDCGTPCQMPVKCVSCLKHDTPVGDVLIACTKHDIEATFMCVDTWTNTARCRKDCYKCKECHKLRVVQAIIDTFPNPYEEV